jgi:hypothetical protein
VFAERDFEIEYTHVVITGVLLLVTCVMAAIRFRQWSVWPIPVLLFVLFAFHPAWAARPIPQGCVVEPANRWSQGFDPLLFTAIGCQMFLWHGWLILTSRKNPAHSTEAVNEYDPAR